MTRLAFLVSDVVEVEPIYDVVQNRRDPPGHFTWLRGTKLTIVEPGTRDIIDGGVHDTAEYCVEDQAGRRGWVWGSWVRKVAT